MKITNQQYKHCDLISIEGRIDSSTTNILVEALDALTNAGRFKIAIDFSNVAFISSVGLRALITTQKTCKRYNRGEVVLCQIPENILATLDLVGFTHLFKTYRDTLSAVGDF